MVIILPALAAKPDGHEQAARPGERLALQRELPRGRRFKGGIHGATLANELVQLERKRPPAIFAKEFPAAC